MERNRDWTDSSTTLMELYAPDALAEVPPHDKEQLGPVMLRGKDTIRKWVDSIARTQVRLGYYIKRQTEGPSGDYEGWRLVYTPNYHGRKWHCLPYHGSLF